MPKVSRKRASKPTDVVDSLGSPGDNDAKDKENKKAAEAQPPSPTTDSKAAVQSEIKAASESTKDDSKNNDPSENDSFDIVLPSMLGTSNAGECTLMVEVSPEDASTLDYEGITGAIGRFEANHHGVIVDLKGNRYQGSILPGPTALVVTLAKGGQLKAESITDEFVTLAKTKDVMKSLDAVVKGEFDEGFRVRDENVNKTAKPAASKAEDGGKEVTPKTKKRASVSSAKSSTRKKKKT